MTKCKAFDDHGGVDHEINTWLELLGSGWKIVHVTHNKYRVVVFVEKV